jgi:hypothetical protein
MGHGRAAGATVAVFSVVVIKRKARLVPVVRA